MDRIPRILVGEFFNNFVLPEVFDRLDQVFPEFDWQRKGGGGGGGGKWESGPGMAPDVRDRFGRAGRAFCKARTPWQFAVAGRDATRWTAYVLGSAGEPSGDEFRRAVVLICERAGIDTGPITNETVSAEDRARYAAQAEQRRAEARERAVRAEAQAADADARSIAQARKLVGAVVAEAAERDQTPLERYRKRRGRDQAKMPGGQWPTGVVYGSVMAGRTRITAAIVPIYSADGKVTGCQRIPIDELGESRPAVFNPKPDQQPWTQSGPVKRATLGRVRGSAARIGRGFPDRVLVLCEGQETGEAVHEATGWTVWPCISTGGLRTVEIGDAHLAQIDAIIVAADLDRVSGDGRRPGQEAARDAADRLRGLYGVRCAVACPAHAWAPDLVTPEELPKEGKSVDWEDVVNRMGGEIARQRFGLSRAAATTEIQGPLPWEIPGPSGGGGGGGGSGDGSGDDRRDTGEDGVDGVDGAPFLDPGDPGPGLSGHAPAGAQDGEQRDRSKPRRSADGEGWQRWHKGAGRWVGYDLDLGLWIEPTGPVLPASNLDAAHEYLLARHGPPSVGRDGGGLTLIAVAGRPYRYGGTRWIEYADAPAEVIRGEVRRYFAPHCKARLTRGKIPVRYFVPADISKSEVDSIASAAIDETRAITPNDDYLSQFWLRPNVDRDGDIVVDHAAWERRIDRPAEHGLPQPESVIPLRNGLFDVDEWVRSSSVRMVPHSPLFFSTGVIEADLDAQRVGWVLEHEKTEGLEAYARSLCPEWIALLEHCFRHPDPSAAETTIRELHKLVGYYLTTSTRRHEANIGWLIGPPGCGKSVILSVIEALLGPTNCVSSSFSEMDNDFHLHSWLGKRLAIFPDLGSSGRIDKINVTEKLKKISTGDPVNINRKHLDAIGNHRLSARLLIIANAMPGLPDPSGAIMRRSICFDFRNPIKAHLMDNTLADRIRKPQSMAGVLLLAMIGLLELEDQGFEQPRWSMGPLEDLREQGSRYPGFIESCLVLNEDESWVSTGDLTRAYKAYAEAEGASYAPDSARLVAEIRPLLIQAGWVEVKRNQRQGINGYAGIRLAELGRALIQSEQVAGSAAGGYDDIPFA